MDWKQIKLGREEHGFICGMTGSGKSKLAEFLVNDPDKPWSVVYDPKHSRTLGEWKNQTIIYKFEELDESHARRILYRPDLEEAEDREMQEAFFRWIYVQQHVRVYVDECSALLGDSKPNLYLKGCLTRGRELGVSVLAATQRPVSIPLITMSEASRLYIFQLSMPEDQERIAKITGITEREQATLRRHEFFYFDVMEKTSHPLYKQKLKLDLGRVTYDEHAASRSRKTAIDPIPPEHSTGVPA